MSDCGCGPKVDGLKEDFDRLDHQLNGNGQAGLVQKIDQLLIWRAEAKGSNDARIAMEKQNHRNNTIRLNLLLLIVTALGIYLAFIKR